MAKEPETEEEEASDSNEALTSIYMSRLARRVREARRRAKLKQSDLGTLIGSNQSYIFLVEAAHANVTFKNFIRIAHALNVNPEDLLKPDQTVPVVNEEKVQELSSLVQSSILEMRSTNNNIAKIDEILHRIRALLTEHSENLKATSPSED